MCFPKKEKGDRKDKHRGAASRPEIGKAEANRGSVGAVAGTPLERDPRADLLQGSSWAAAGTCEIEKAPATGTVTA